ncbi:MAG TPA: carboxypeptidase-like regulatory domain-containing protein, partial [Polyangiaceae bacterium]|nr:carboxypeptidase-like regulatory domain-containing protein [Polyangiaceae bacterium]
AGAATGGSAGAATGGSAGTAGSGGGSAVQGKVVDLLGLAVPNVPVVIAGQQTATGADGSFSIPNVAATYTASIVSPNGVAYVYADLKRRDPQLQLRMLAQKEQTGTLSGHAPALKPDFDTKSHHAVFASENGRSDPSFSSIFDSTTWSVTPEWYGASTVSGFVHLIQRTKDAQGKTLSYSAYGRLPVTLSAGGSLTQLPIAVSNPAEGKLTGTVTVPSGYTLKLKRVDTNFSDTSSVHLHTDATAAAAFDFLTFDVGSQISGFTLLVSADGAGDTAMQIVPANATQNVNVTLQKPPALITPVANATGVTTSTSFSVAEMNSSVSVIHFIPDTSGQPNVYVITSANTATIPDLSGLGLALPSEAGYRWQVLGVGGFTDTDSTAGKDGVFDAAEYNLSRRKRVSVWRNYGISEIRKFTTGK